MAHKKSYLSDTKESIERYLSSIDVRAKLRIVNKNTFVVAMSDPAGLMRLEAIENLGVSLSDGYVLRVVLTKSAHSKLLADISAKLAPFFKIAKSRISVHDGRIGYARLYLRVVTQPTQILYAPSSKTVCMYAVLQHAQCIAFAHTEIAATAEHILKAILDRSGVLTPLTYRPTSKLFGD